MNDKLEFFILNNGVVDFKTQQLLKKSKYIVFSSGSTGEPKQIYMKDFGLVKVVKEQSKILKVNKDSNFLWLLNSSFDASLSDIYCTLLNGGTLYSTNIQPNKIKTIVKFLIDYKITHSDIPPVVLNLLNKYLLKIKDEKFFQKINFIVGGELINEKLIQDLENNFNFSFFNAYGPTENTICTYLEKISLDKNKSISYSFEEDILKNSFLSSNQNYFLFKNIALNKNVDYLICSVNDKIDNCNLENNVFELYISGFITNGYNIQQLNEEKFIYFNNKKFFKTGDLIKIKKEKNKDSYYFSYFGRNDRQFKYNGKLISPEEIEYIAFQCGAENCKLFLDDNKKMNLTYQGEIDESKFLSLIPNYMKPIKLILIEKVSLNRNWKISLNKNDQKEI